MYNIYAKVFCSQPTLFLLRLYDPLSKNTEYIIRQIGSLAKLVNGSVEAYMPVPFGYKEGLKVTAMCLRTHSLLPVVINRVTRTKPAIFEPRLSRFLAFAKSFSLKSGDITKGKYYSDNSEFCIRVVDKIVASVKGTNGNIVRKTIQTSVAVDLDTGVIQVCNKEWKSLTIYNRVMILLHEYNHYIKQTKDEFDCDLFSYQVATKMGISQYERLFTLIRAFRSIPSESEKMKRIEKMNEYLTAELN